MKAILIAAGRSNRFWPLQEKNLFPVCGTTLIEHQVRLLDAVGISSKDIIIIAGKHNRLEIARRIKGKKIIEQTNLDRGMQGAMESALKHTKDEEILVLSGNDIVTKDALCAVLRASEKKGIDGVLLAKRVPSYFPGGYLVMKGARITGIIEKPVPGKEPSNLVNIVVHFHRDTTALSAALRSVSGKEDGYEKAITFLLGTHTYIAARYSGAWFPVKYPWHVLDALPYALSCGQRMIHPTATIHPTAVIEGSVVLSEGVKVLPHATIVGPCFIGPQSIIANNALVRESSIGSQCVIGYSSEIARSVLADKVWTHMSYVGDSVLGSNVSLGGGTTTGNLRLDEKEVFSVVRSEAISTQRIKFGSIIGDHCRLGIHTTLAPGVKIGENSFVESSCYVTEDIPENSFVKMKQGILSVRPNRESPLPPRN